ncbi:UNVERIFIED_CONTAM: Retrovirus-related Pol polyprotein from transposon RE1 [Sesamum indicum]
MVVSWILNSIKREIADCFMYTNTSRALWKELENRYDQSNGPMEYQLKKELGGVIQGTMSLSAYFSKIMKLWDELSCITPTPSCTCGNCTCGSSKESARIKENDQLIQFLMGLNEAYDDVRSQILVMEPRPDINKAYSMVLNVEKQREVNFGQSQTTPNMAMQVFRKQDNSRNFQKRKNMVDKKSLVCKHCGKTGHQREGCLKSLDIETGTNLSKSKRRTTKSEFQKLFEELKSQGSGSIHADRTREVIGIACLAENLYIIKTKSFDKRFIEDVLADFRYTGFIVAKIEPDTWHKRLGHLSHDVLINIGYANNQKGYRVYDVNKKVIFTSRDVVYKENIFPFADECTDPINSDVQTYNQPVTSIIEDQDEQDTHMQPIPEIIEEHTPVNNQQEHIPDDMYLRRSRRHIVKPAKLQDYVCACNKEDNDILTVKLQNNMDMCMNAVINMPNEPKNYSEAMKDKEWVEAINLEIKPLEDNDTWDITELPAGKKAIGSKWVYKLKLKPDGSMDRYKARLIAKGYNQIEGIDYNDSFSPIAKAVTIRTFLVVVCKQNWFLHQLDINNAFLHGFIDEDIYMKPPEGYIVPTGHICKLKRSLYGLKQASRQWNLEFTKQLEKIGFTQSKADHCLFTILTDAGFFCLLVYVDDVLIAGPCEHTIAGFKTKLHNLFTIKNLGKARFFLGLEIGRSNEGMIITQDKYVRDIIADAGLTQCKATNTPLLAGLQLKAASGQQLSNSEPYRRLLGRLLYLGFTRPDICHATQQLRQFMQFPCQDHWEAA